MKLYFAGSPNRAFKMAKGQIPKLKTRKLLNFDTEKNDLKKYFKNGMKVFVDSGAYTAHTQGSKIDIDEYIDFLNKYDEHIIIAAQLDVMPGNYNEPKTNSDYREAEKQTYENYMYMVKRLKSPDKCIPIFHRGVKMKYLKKYIDSGAPYIGISPYTGVSTKEKIKWLRNVFDIIKNSSNPNVKTHAFGMTSLPVLEQFPFTSADSTGWILAGAYGAIVTPLGRISISEKTCKKPGGFETLSKQKKLKLKKYVEKHNESLEDLKKKTNSRIRLHVKYLLEWEENYKFKGQQISQKSLF